MSDIPDQNQPLATFEVDSFGDKKLIIDDQWFYFLEALNQSTSTGTTNSIPAAISVSNTGIESDVSDQGEIVSALLQQNAMLQARDAEIETLKNQIADLFSLIESLRITPETNNEDNQTWLSSLGNLQAS